MGGGFPAEFLRGDVGECGAVLGFDGGGPGEVLAGRGWGALEFLEGVGCWVGAKKSEGRVCRWLLLLLAAAVLGGMVGTYR